MHVVLSIDDTDNMDSRGTGELASLLSDAIQEKGWGTCQPVTRHQLLVHPDIPYTSHNSAMCFATDVREACLNDLASYASEFLQTESTEDSDPGLCIVCVERLADATPLIDFGREAKRSLLTVQQAYGLARRLRVHLSAHGGTGQGVIGALAGAGLRLSGNDGKMRGSLELSTQNGMVSVRELLENPAVDAVRSLDGNDLNGEAVILLGEKPKTVMLGGKLVLLVHPLEDATEGKWRTLTRQEMRRY